MKTFTSSDQFGSDKFVIRRADAKAKLDKSELPNPSERIMLNGEERTVVGARFIGDYQFGYFPEIILTVMP